MNLDPESSLGYQVRRCHRRFDRLLASHLAPRGLKSGYWYYLRVLWLKDGVTQEQLSRSTNVTQNTTVTMIAGMIKTGLVRRERDTHDRRKMRVYLTERGRRLEAELISFATAINKIASKGIKGKELDTCLQVLKRMSENLQVEFDRIGQPE
jgi:MarR family transcriptional regulator, organic hydroperoxide resistance regulator